MRSIVIVGLALAVYATGGLQLRAQESTGQPGKIVEVATANALMKTPFGLDFLPNGDAVFADFGSHRILRLDASGKITLIAGDGSAGFADGIADKAKFNAPHNVCVGPDGIIYVSDTLNHRVRRVDPVTGQVTTIAGSQKGQGGDGGPANKAQFNELYHVAMEDPAGLIVVDLMNRKIRRVDLNSMKIDSIAGSGKKGPFVEGSQALEACLTDPRAAARGPDGSLWILERGGNCLRRVDPQGTVSTVAGTGKSGPVADGPAAMATLRSPKYLWISRDDRSIWLADSSNHAIRRFDRQKGELATVAGTGKAGKGIAGGDPRTTALDQPHGVAVDSQGRIWISDSQNGRILRMEK